MGQSGYSLRPAGGSVWVAAKAVASLSGGESNRREKMPVPEPSSIRSRPVVDDGGVIWDWMYFIAGAGYEGLALYDRQ